MKADKQKRPGRSALALWVLGLLGLAGGAANAAVRIDGQVQAGGGPVADSTVTLWAGSAGEPKQLAQGKTAGDGSFALGTDETPGPRLCKKSWKKGERSRSRKFFAIFLLLIDLRPRKQTKTTSV